MWIQGRGHRIQHRCRVQAEGREPGREDVKRIKGRQRWRRGGRPTSHLRIPPAPPR
jgi:hypothetical protein